MTDPRRPSTTARPQDTAWHIRNQFTDMPGMRLTFEQVRRLASLTDAECGDVLERLVGEGLLTRNGDDRFCRPDR